MSSSSRSFPGLSFLQLTASLSARPSFRLPLMRSLTLFFFALSFQVLHWGTVFARLDRNPPFHPTPVTRTGSSQALNPAIIVASRQHHQHRALLDVCAYINTEDLLFGDILGIPLEDLLDLKLCLCLSALPLELTLDLKLKALTNKYGKSLVDAVISALVRDSEPVPVRILTYSHGKINMSPNSKHCAYPAHSQQVCSDSDPCGFSCDPPYKKCGAQCVCAPPNTECNGVCGHFPHVSSATCLRVSWYLHV